jgi:hypothetical protein
MKQVSTRLTQRIHDLLESLLFKELLKTNGNNRSLTLNYIVASLLTDYVEKETQKLKKYGIDIKKEAAIRKKDHSSPKKRLKVSLDDTTYDSLLHLVHLEPVTTSLNNKVNHIVSLSLDLRQYTREDTIINSKNNNTE